LSSKSPHPNPLPEGEGIATPSPRERIGVRARKTENYFGFSIKHNLIPSTGMLFVLSEREQVSGIFG